MKLNRIEQSAYMCRDLNNQKKNDLCAIISQARSKLRRVSTVEAPVLRGPRKTTATPAEWKLIRQKMKAVQAFKSDM